MKKVTIAELSAQSHYHRKVDESIRDWFLRQAASRCESPRWLQKQTKLLRIADIDARTLQNDFMDDVSKESYAHAVKWAGKKGFGIYEEDWLSGKVNEQVGPNPDSDSRRNSFNSKGSEVMQIKKIEAVSLLQSLKFHNAEKMSDAKIQEELENIEASTKDDDVQTLRNKSKEQEESGDSTAAERFKHDAVVLKKLRAALSEGTEIELISEGNGEEVNTETNEHSTEPKKGKGRKAKEVEQPKGEILFLAPEDIIADEDENGRAAHHSEEEIQEKVDSILKVGQINPVTVRKVEGSKYKMVAGFCRRLAILKINKDGLKKTPLPIKAVVVEKNDEEAFLANLAENMHRNDLTPIDHAHNQRVLREDYAWSDNRIKKFYNISLAYVSQLRKVHQMPAKVQEEVKSGKMAFSAALDIADLPEEEQKEIVESSKKEGTDEVDSTEVKKKAREKAPEGAKKGRTVKEIKEFFEGLTGPAEAEGLRTLAEAMLKFISGEIKKDSLMEKKLNALFSKEEAEATA